MNIGRIFVKGLAWLERDFLLPSQLHHHGTLQHVNKHLGIVAVDRARIARREIYGVHQSLLAGRSCQIFLYELGNSLLRHRRRDRGLRHQHAGCGQEAGDEKCQHQHWF